MIRTIGKTTAVILAICLLVSCSSSGSGGSDSSSTVDVPEGDGGASDNGTEANTLNLEWDPPANNEDGSELTDLAGYTVYLGTEPGVYTSEFDVGFSNEVEVVDLEDGTYYLAVTSYDLYGNESDFSNEVSSIVP